MVRWKRFGLIIDFYKSDHFPRHVHIYEDGKPVVKFDIESWEVLAGELSFKARRALESLRAEGVFHEKPKV